MAGTILIVAFVILFFLGVFFYFWTSTLKVPAKGKKLQAKKHR